MAAKKRGKTRATASERTKPREKPKPPVSAAKAGDELSPTPADT
jgi:hypothetical protein